MVLAACALGLFVWTLFRGAAALDEPGPAASSAVVECYRCGAAVTAWHTYPDGTAHCSECRRPASR